MTARSRGARAASSLIRNSHPRVCTECISTLQRRSYASAAAALKPSPSSSSAENTPTTSSTTPIKPTYQTHASIVLSRPPLLTPPQTPFERAFFFYQKRLNERLVMPFTRYFYFKKDTPADADWKIKAKERNWAPAKELGGYNPYDREGGWNDEILTKEAEALVGEERLRNVLVEDAKVRAREGEEVEDAAGAAAGEGDEAAKGLEVELLGRRTESDKKGDVRRLDRELERTLYLVVKRAGGGWGFPSGEVIGREGLHQTAERVLVQSAGINMNTWLVGRVPIGFHVRQPYRATKEADSPSASTSIIPGVKTFFLKARIMAGQADLKDNLFGLEDFKWLTREELEKVLGNKYMSSVRKFLHDR